MTTQQRKVVYALARSAVGLTAHALTLCSDICCDEMCELLSLRLVYRVAPRYHLDNRVRNSLWADPDFYDVGTPVRLCNTLTSCEGRKFFRGEVLRVECMSGDYPVVLGRDNFLVLPRTVLDFAKSIPVDCAVAKRIDLQGE